MIIPKRILDKYIELNSYKLGDIYFPNEFLTIRQNKIMIANKFREERLKNRSPNEIDFRNKIYELRSLIKFPDVIEEAQIFIEDKILWNKILDHFKILKDSNERFRNFFQADFMFPDVGVIFEVDSDYHNNKEVEDKARDKYMELKYNIITYRCKYYSSKIHNLNDFFEVLRTRDYYENINFNSTFLNLLEYKEKETISNLKKIDDYTEGDVIYTNQNIAITMKDLFLANWIDTNENCKITRDMINAQDFLKTYDNRVLYIHNGSKDYTTKEAISVYKEENWNNWRNKMIPGWVIGIKGKPPKGFKYDISNGFGRSKEFIEKLKSLKIIRED